MTTVTPARPVTYHLLAVVHLKRSADGVDRKIYIPDGQSHDASHALNVLEHMLQALRTAPLE